MRINEYKKVINSKLTKLNKIIFMIRLNNKFNNSK